MVSSLSQRMIRTATMLLMASGAGLAGYSYYLDQQAEAAGYSSQLVWVKDHATWFIALGVAGLVLGFVINMVTARRMQKRMMGNMGGMGMGGMGGMAGTGGMGAGGMPDMGRLMAMQGMAANPTLAAPTEVVKVRCKSCSSLESEAAAFCSKCGKPLA